MTTVYAHCSRSGQITLSTSPTEPGLLRLGEGQGDTFRNTVGTLARLAYDGETLLVPGLPEAATDIEALQAVSRFMEELDRRNPSYQAANDNGTSQPGLHDMAGGEG